MGPPRKTELGQLPGPSGFAKLRSPGSPVGLESMQINIQLQSKPLLAHQDASKSFQSPAFKNSRSSHVSTNITGNHDTTSASNICSAANFKSQQTRWERPSTSYPTPKHYQRKARVVSVTKENAFSLAGELYGLKDKSFVNPDLIRVASQVVTPYSKSSLAGRHQGQQSRNTLVSTPL